MSKILCIGICCVALLATGVASGAFTEDFEGYTGNAGDKWTDTPEFAASGWGQWWSGTTEGNGPITPYVLAAGQNSTQSVDSRNASSPYTESQTSMGHLLDAPQGPNSTFVWQWDWHGDGRAFVGGAGKLYSNPDSGPGITFGTVGDNVKIYYPGGQTPWLGTNPFHNLTTEGWSQLKVEIDTDALARPTDARLYYRDLAEDGSGPIHPLTGDPDPTWWFWGEDEGMDVLDWQIEAIGYMAYRAGTAVDNISATPEPATLAVLGIGGLLALLRRRR
jgi:hypothetical protein